MPSINEKLQLLEAKHIIILEKTRKPILDKGLMKGYLVASCDYALSNETERSVKYFEKAEGVLNSFWKYLQFCLKLNKNYMRNIRVYVFDGEERPKLIKNLKGVEKAIESCKGILYRNSDGKTCIPSELSIGITRLTDKKEVRKYQI